MEHTGYHEVLKPTLRTLKSIGRFVLDRFTSPYPLNPPSSYEGADEMLLTEDVSGAGYYTTPVPDVSGRDISRGWTDMGEYMEREV